MENIYRLLDEVENSLYNKSNFIKLTEENTSEYERGKQKGKLEIINKIRMELQSNDKDESKK